MSLKHSQASTAFNVPQPVEKYDKTTYYMILEINLRAINVKKTAIKNAVLETSKFTQ